MGRPDTFTAGLHIASKCVSQNLPSPLDVRVHVLNRTRNASILSFIQPMFKITHIKAFSSPHTHSFDVLNAENERVSFYIPFYVTECKKTSFAQPASGPVHAGVC